MPSTEVKFDQRLIRIDRLDRMKYIGSYLVKMNLREMERVGLSRTISFARLIGPKSFPKFKLSITVLIVLIAVGFMLISNLISDFVHIKL